MFPHGRLHESIVLVEIGGADKIEQVLNPSIMGAFGIDEFGPVKFVNDGFFVGARLVFLLGWEGGLNSQVVA